MTVGQKNDTDLNQPNQSPIRASLVSWSSRSSQGLISFLTIPSFQRLPESLHCWPPPPFSKPANEVESFSHPTTLISLLQLHLHLGFSDSWLPLLTFWDLCYYTRLSYIIQDNFSILRSNNQHSLISSTILFLLCHTT